MKNSTLLRLFFISIGIPLTCASSSASSTLTPKSKSKSNTASLLVDTSNSAPAVQPEGTVTGVPSVPGEISVSGMKDKVSKQLEALINSGEYGKVIKLGDEMSDKQLLKCFCQVVTTLDQFKGLYEYLKQREMVPNFLARGEMVLVRKIIVETDLLEIYGLGRCNDIYDAIALSFKEDCHECVAGLFEAAKKRPDWRDEFGVFVTGFFTRYPFEKDNMPLKRFLTLHGEEFSRQHPATFEAICKELLKWLKCGPGDLDSQKLLIDLVGQPSLLTPIAFAEGFLVHSIPAYRANFINYGYKEAIEEGLKEKYPGGGRELWDAITSWLPDEFSGAYPDTDGARSIALKDFRPTKQDLEEEWAEENAPILLKHLEMLVTEPPLYRDLLSIVAEYAITWVVV